MALLRLFSSCSRCRRSSDFPKAFRVFSFSTEASPPPSPDSTSPTLKLSGAHSTPKVTLFNRLSPLGKLGAQVSPVLDQWVSEGRSVNQSQVLWTIKQLIVFKRFDQALEVCEWMSKHVELSPEGIAVRLDLISNVHGLKEAEVYFDSLPSNSRELRIYCALLKCYVREKSTEKAETTRQKMRDLGYFTTRIPYNLMLKLYCETREYEKLEALVQEMEEKSIVGDKYTYRHLLDAYSAKSDMEGMEKIVAKITADPLISVDWNVYVGAASGYLKAGLKDKALEMLKTSEQFLDAKSKKYAYEILMTFYAKLENKDEVHRLWNLCKKTGKAYNKTYFAVLCSLEKLDDIEGMEKIYEEWDANVSVFESRIPNLLVGAYCKKGLMEKAESVVKRLVESGNSASATMWDHMATGYYKHGQLEKAVEAMKKATLVSHSKWKANFETLSGCAEYLREKGDGEYAEFKSLLDKRRHSSVDVSDTMEIPKERNTNLNNIFKPIFN